MRICLLNQTFFPETQATAQQLTDLAQYLVAQGHEIWVISDRNGYEDRRKRLPAAETHEGIRIVRVASTRFGRGSFWLRAIDGLSFQFSVFLKLFALPTPDLLVSFTSPPLIGVVAGLYCRLAGVRLIQWLMDVNPAAAVAVGYLHPRARVTRLLEWAFERSLSVSRKIVVLDRWMQRRVEAMGVPPERMVVVPPWPAHDHDEDLGADPAGARRFRARHGLEGKFVVLFSGNHSIVHPLDTVLAAALAMRGDPSVVFLFIGGGLRVEEVRAFREHHGLENITQLPPQRREGLGESLASADLHVVVMGEAVNGLVHTSKVYGILATGLPFVAVGPRDSHLGDLIRECPSGFRVDHGDPSGFAEIIRLARGLSAQEKLRIRDTSLAFLKNRYSRARSLETFRAAVLGESRASGTVASDVVRQASG